MEQRQCIVCHKIVDEQVDNSVRCVFCDSLSHVECVEAWLVMYNACPMCQNPYVKPRIILVGG